MTAKEAAQKTGQAAKKGLKSLRLSPVATALVVLGAILAAAGSHLPQLPDWFSWSGLGSAAWGVFLFVSEHYSKRTSDATAEKVSGRMVESIQTLVNETLVPDISRAHQRIEKLENDHDDCLAEHREKHQQLSAEQLRQRHDLNRIAGAVESVKPGWKLGLGS